MPTLADMFNAPTEMEFDGVKYQLREPTLLEEGTFQRWLEQRAYDAIERRTYQDAVQQTEDRRLLNQDIATGVYEYGGPLCIQSLNTPAGAAALLGIVLRDQGITELLAKKMVELRLREVVAGLAAKAISDPKALAGILNGLGFPADYLSSKSATPHSTSDPKPSGDSVGLK